MLVSTFNTTFIGAGNMSSSIIGGLLNAGMAADTLSAADPVQESLDRFQALGLAYLGTDNRAAVANADVVVLAVKPQVLATVCHTLAPALRPGQLVLSIAAGVELESLRSWLGEAPDLVRCMPNTPALLGLGASALYAPDSLSQEQRQRAATIMQAVGVVRWVTDEDLLHTVTALSGSGPAYFFRVMEAMIETAQTMGLDEETARTLCAQTCLGAGHMLADSDVDAAELRRRVTSPGGTTERALASFEKAGLGDVVRHAMEDCAARSVELARELA